MRKLALALFLALTGPSAADDSVKGPAQVRDSVTIAIAGSRFRLADITAPEKETCGGKDCAEVAMLILGAKLSGHEVTCAKDRRLGHGYFLARCKLDDGTDVAILSVEEGLAVPLPNPPPSYKEAAEEAKSQGRGLWSK